MHISKDQRLDAISGRDQMAERPPDSHAVQWFRRPAYHNCSVLDYLEQRNIDTGEEIGRGTGTENRERIEKGIPPEL